MAGAVNGAYLAVGYLAWISQGLLCLERLVLTMACQLHH